jgi:hypothetical protein
MIELSDVSNADDSSSDSNSEVEASNCKAASSSTRDTCSSSFFFSPAYTGCKATTAARKISRSTNLNAKGRAIQLHKAARKR